MRGFQKATMSGMAPMMGLWLVEVKAKADDVGD